MTTQEILSERLVEVRKINGYTRRRLAEELNRPYRTITNYETGEHEPGHKYLIEIAKKFGVTTDYLLGLSDDPQKTADDEKKIPDTIEVAPGDNVLDIFNFLNSGLVSLGLLDEDEDITKQQAEILISVARILHAAFDKG